MLNVTAAAAAAVSASHQQQLQQLQQQPYEQQEQVEAATTARDTAEHKAAEAITELATVKQQLAAAERAVKQYTADAQALGECHS
jgi:septal ring factor EnvC (AmiA/AmiB activator)